jgi:triphosphoribosyl-dephospho-CoA synthase
MWRLFSMNSLCLPLVRLTPASIARCAANALTEELATYPKPGLVSFVDRGSHPDMDAECFLASIEAIKPYFGEMAKAGATGCRLLDLQRIGIAAEESMLDATGGKKYPSRRHLLPRITSGSGRQTNGRRRSSWSSLGTHRGGIVG